MTSRDSDYTAVAARARLAQGLVNAGDLADPGWRDAFEQVPRHLLVPRFYYDAGHAISSDDPETRTEWFAAVHEDRALVTQRTNGAATSSASQPSVMAIMLEALAVEDGMNVLEIGTGTGYNAGLLAQRLGDDQVVTIDLSAEVTDTARDRLATAGYQPLVVIGDGAAGYPDRAPYDRIIVTCRLDRVPPALIRQLTDGGLIVAPVGNAVARIRRTGQDMAEGRFLAGGAYFMPLRKVSEAIALPHRPDLPAGQPRLSTLPASVVGDNSFRFLARIVKPGLVWQYELDDGRELEDRQIIGARVWSREGSLAHLRSDGTVAETGPRPLWRELERAYAVFRDAGQPGPDRYGITIADRVQRVWMDVPDGPSWLLRP
jgi:protein-L-isoaspartate(D-aspartate) O-methyltransferase